MSGFAGNEVCGVVSSLQVSESEKYGVSTFVTLSGALTLLSPSGADKLPAVGNEAVFSVERAGKVAKIKSWRWVDSKDAIVTFPAFQRASAVGGFNR